MATIYFVRHAQPDYTIQEDDIRRLTKKGLKDREAVSLYLADKHIDILFSSPYKRAVDTIALFAERNNLPIHTNIDLRERKIGSVWVDDYYSFSKHQWDDFNYKNSDGESLAEVQCRNVSALKEILEQYNGKNIVIGTHGAALSTIIHYYDETYGLEDFYAMIPLMPWIVRFEFDGQKCVQIEKIDVLNLQKD